MRTRTRRIVALLAVICILITQLSASLAAGWISVEKNLRSPLGAEQVDVNIRNVGKRISNVCYDLQCEYPTSLYQLTANGVRHDALCVAAKRTTPGDGGKVYKLDLSGLKSCQGENSRLLEASANLTEADAGYSVWWNAYRYSDLAKYNDEQIMRKIAWLIEDGNWTYYPLKQQYSASDLYSGIELDYDDPINDPKVYRDLEISTDAQARFKAFDIPSSRVGAKISGLYGAAHAIASRVISGDRYHLSGTIYYSFTRTEADKATYTKGSHSAFAYGDDGNGNDNNKYRRIQLMQYFNIIAHAPEYKGDLFIYSPDERSGGGQQWLLFVDKYAGKKAYIRPVIDKKTASGDVMNGAEFTLYEDASCSKEAGVISDKNGSGDYSEYVNKLAGDDQKDGLLLLDNNNDGSYTKTVYFKETKAPSSVCAAKGGKMLLDEGIIDGNVYCMNVEYGYDTGALKIDIRTAGKSVYSKTYKNYDAFDKPGEVRLANNRHGDFRDGAALYVLKESGNGFTVTNTVFELYKGSDTTAVPAAYYMYKDGWSWFADRAGDNEIGAAYPVLLSAQYTLVEEYTEDCYKDSGISYDVVNRSGWTETGDNRYMYTFTTDGMNNGDTLTVKAVNDRVTSSVSVIKKSDDGNISGVGFELYYLGNKDQREKGEGLLIDSFKTDKNGKGSVKELPLGWYRVREVKTGDYSLTWGSGTVTDGDDAIVRLTAKDTGGVSLEAVNRLMVKIAVVKTDSDSGKYIGGASFRLYEDTSERKTVAEISDEDNDGICVFDKIGIGDYLIEEIKAPAGYYLNKTLIPVKVTGRPDGRITVSGNEVMAYKAEVGDKPYSAPLHIIKTDSRDRSIVLEGAVFEIYEDTNGTGEYEPEADKKATAIYKGKKYDVALEFNNGRYEAVINAGGNKTAYLRFGTYFIVETASPEMYLLPSGITKAVIPQIEAPAEGEAVSVEVNIINDMGFCTVLTGISGTKVAELGKDVVLTDHVYYTNLKAGETYTLKGRLAARDKACNVYGTDVETVKEFTVEDNGSGIKMSDGTVRVSGTVNVSFKIDTSKYKGMELVAYEYLYKGDDLIGSHEDINDKDQSVKIPDIGTELTDKATGSHTVTVSGSTVLTDMVRYEGLVPGKNYLVTGVLVDKRTGSEIKDKDGNPVTSSVSFKAPGEDGYIPVEFTVDASVLHAKEIVAFETVRYEGRPVAIHADINDEDQTVRVPELVTSASGVNGSKLISREKNVTVTDHVEYRNLTPGKTYVVSGSLKYAGTGEAFKDPSGKEVNSEVTFIPASPDGSVDVKLLMDASGLHDGDMIVVYEDAYVRADDGGEDILICRHRDPLNKAQTVTVTDVPKTGSGISESEYVTVLLSVAGIVLSAAGMIVYVSKRKHE